MLQEVDVVKMFTQNVRLCVTVSIYRHCFNDRLISKIGNPKQELPPEKVYLNQIHCMAYVTSVHIHPSINQLTEQLIM